jgi:hypothetical protein
VYDDGGASSTADGSTAADVVGSQGDVVVSDEAGEGTGASEAGNGGDGGAPESSSPDAAAEAEAGLVYSCNGQPVASCASCPNNPIGCIFCALDGGHPAVCGPKTYCQNVAPPGAGVCQCPGNNVAACAAPSQVCTLLAGTEYCQTCGESGSGNHPCKGGKTCDEAAGVCK